MAYCPRRTTFSGQLYNKRVSLARRHLPEELRINVGMSEWYELQDIPPGMNTPRATLSGAIQGRF